MTFYSLLLCGDKNENCKKEKNFFFRENHTSPWVPFRVKFWSVGRLVHPSRPQAYSLQYPSQARPVSGNELFFANWRFYQLLDKGHSVPQGFTGRNILRLIRIDH